MSEVTFNSVFKDGPVLFTHLTHNDSRGAFRKLFSQAQFSGALNGKHITQINCSITDSPGTIRGLHFQRPPFSGTKIVTCMRGEIWDVVVDVRLGSPTFLQHQYTNLTADNRLGCIIPEGFAHGFQALTSNCEVLYFHTEEYAVQAEGGLNATDPQLGIDWPMAVGLRSDRDLQHPLIEEGFDGISCS